MVLFQTIPKEYWKLETDMKKYDVFGIGNALVDCVILVTEKFLKENNIEKGLMTLVDDQKQKTIIEKITNSDPFIQSGGSVTNSVYTLSQLGGSGYQSFLISLTLLYQTLHICLPI